MSKTTDVCVIGSGVAGIFACHRILEKKKDLKIILFDIGRPPICYISSILGVMLVFE